MTRADLLWLLAAFLIGGLLAVVAGVVIVEVLS